LSANRQPSAKRCDLSRKEETISRQVYVEVRDAHAFDCLAHTEQDCVAVERTILDTIARHRIYRVALEVPTVLQAAPVKSNRNLLFLVEYDERHRTQ